ncbi:MAG TPA: ABC transporter substrate-binding protein [Nitriliruptorales bacterium]|nr:ABC transporter substrate-binding protein [Nitriliruptorales bacterium]
MSERPVDLSRRDFLKRVGLVGAAMGVPGVLAACGGETGEEASPSPTRPTAPKGELRIGLLVPLSGTYASLGRDMQNGFRLYLDRHDGELGGHKVQVVDAETEANPEVGLRAARRLLEEERTPIVTGVVSSAVAAGVRDLFHESKRPLIVSNAGANDLTRTKRSPHIFRTSFSNWQPSFSLGEWAVEELDIEGFFIIAPDYGAGHEAAEAFRQSYVEEGRGRVISERFPPFGTTQDYQPYLSQISESGARGTFAFFSGGEAISFVQQYAQFGLKEDMPLIGPGFLTDEGVLEAQEDAALGIRTSLHYSGLLDNETNQSFVADYEEAFGTPATVFAVQSYDAAQLIDLALKDHDGDPTDGEAVSEALANVGNLDSPRGVFHLDPETHNPVQTFYIREVKEVDDGLGNVVLKDLGKYQDPGT